MNEIPRSFILDLQKPEVNRGSMGFRSMDIMLKAVITIK